MGSKMEQLVLLVRVPNKDGAAANKQEEGKPLGPICLI